MDFELYDLANFFPRIKNSKFGLVLYELGLYFGLLRLNGRVERFSLYIVFLSFHNVFRLINFFTFYLQ